MKEERLKILQMVDDGKLSVSEALMLLEQLEEGHRHRQEDDGDTFVNTRNFKRVNDDDYYDNYETESPTDKIFAFVDSAVKKVRQLDLDFNFGKFKTVNHIFQQTGEKIEKVNIDIANGSVRLIPWEQGDIRIECELKVYSTNNVDEARQQFLQAVLFYIEKGQLQFQLQQKTIKADVVCYIPQSMFSTVDIRLFNGPITVENINSEYIQAKTANGKLSFKAISADDVNLETANGHITVNNSVINKIECETINGKVELTGNFHKVNAKTFNGNIRTVLKGERCKFVDLKAVTGAIEAEVSEDLLEGGLFGQLKTNFGNFKVKLGKLELVEEKNELAQKLFRFRTISENEQQLHIFADTKTGSIALRKESTF